MSTSLTILTLTTIFAICISAQSINFEAPTYVLGNINGQDGWSKTGPYDVFVSSSGGTAGFGAQSLRISNGVTSGSFGDQAFSKSNPNEAGETSAQNGGGKKRAKWKHDQTMTETNRDPKFFAPMHRTSCTMPQEQLRQ